MRERLDLNTYLSQTLLKYYLKMNWWALVITLSLNRTGNQNLTENHLNLYFGVTHQSLNTHKPSLQAVQCCQFNVFSKLCMLLLVHTKINKRQLCWQHRKFSKMHLLSNRRGQNQQEKKCFQASWNANNGVKKSNLEELAVYCQLKTAVLSKFIWLLCNVCFILLTNSSQTGFRVLLLISAFYVKREDIFNFVRS